jgi:hypothetical protein
MGIYREGLIENGRMEICAVRAYFLLSFGATMVSRTL